VTEAQTVSSEVEVAVDAATAFKAFTEEMDLWWVRGPINFWSDGGRVVEVRCEPGVGGRIMEVLDDPGASTVLERARITRWEPGALLAFASSLDDVQTEVSFVPTPAGTRVKVEHLIPAGGADKGGTAWSRVVPEWFGGWCAKRDRVPHEQIDIALPEGPDRCRKASTGIRGSSSGSATRSSTSSSSTASGAATSARTSRGSTSTTSRRTSRTRRGTARRS
jgi:hypothetical protein